MTEIEDPPSEQELRDAAELAAALERDAPVGASDEVATAEAVRTALGDPAARALHLRHRRDAIVARAVRARAASRRTQGVRAVGAVLAAAAAVVLVLHLRREVAQGPPTTLAPAPLAILTAQLAAVVQGDSLHLVDREMSAYRGQLLASMADHYGPVR